MPQRDDKKQRHATTNISMIVMLFPLLSSLAATVKKHTVASLFLQLSHKIVLRVAQPFVIREMAIVYTCPSFDMPDYDKESDFLWRLQDNSFVTWFETQTWQIKIELGLFPDGKYFLHLHVLSGVALRLMDEEVWANTCCQGMPVHITLGWPLTFNDMTVSEFEQQLALAVEGVHTLTVKKWSWDRSSGTYLPQGTLLSLCDSLRGHFEPWGKWHMSL